MVSRLASKACINNSKEDTSRGIAANYEEKIWQTENRRIWYLRSRKEKHSGRALHSRWVVAHIRESSCRGKLEKTLSPLGVVMYRRVPGRLLPAAWIFQVITSIPFHGQLYGAII